MWWNCGWAFLRLMTKLREIWWLDRNTPRVCGLLSYGLGHGVLDVQMILYSYIVYNYYTWHVTLHVIIAHWCHSPVHGMGCKFLQMSIFLKKKKSTVLQHNRGYAVCNLRGACRESLAACGGARTTSVTLVGGEEDCIRTNYDTIYTVCLMYYVHNRSKVSGAKVWRSEGSEMSKYGVWDLEVWGAVVRRFEYRFQPSQCNVPILAMLDSASKTASEELWSSPKLSEPRLDPRGWTHASGHAHRPLDSVRDSYLVPHSI